MRYSSWLIPLLAVVAAAAADAGVTVDWARQVDFSKYETFGWIEGTAADDPEVDRILRRAIGRELESKGLRRLDEGADLLVRTHLMMRDEERHDVDILGYEGRWAEDSTPSGSPGEYLREIGVGTVVVDLLDGHSKLQVWQGIAGAVARPEPGKKSEKRINRAIGKMFRRFPPQQDGRRE